MKYIPFILLIIPLLLLISCKPTQVTTAESGSDDEKTEETESPSAMLIHPSDLEQYRNTLADPFLNAQNQIAPIFELTEADLESVDSRSGFRIQLISTDDMVQADEVSLKYYDWAVERKLPYDRIPEAYVLFRQPYYRVRVGDFKNRSQAIEYLNILRPHFQGAWIVLDTIEPERAPE